MMVPRPPAELRPLARRTQRLLLPLWLACLALAVLAQAGATWRLWVFQSFTNPVFSSVGLWVPYADGRQWWVEPRAAGAQKAGLEGAEHIEAVGATALDRDAEAEDAARLIARTDGDTVALRLAGSPTKAGREVRLARSEAIQREVFANQIRWYSIASHIADLSIALLLIVVAALLRWRRPAHPVATLVSFALLFLATLGCWRLWAWLGTEWIEPLLSIAWLGLMLISIPALPDGRYVPRWSRWFMLLGPIAAIALVRNDDGLVDAAIVCVTGAALLSAIALRFLSTPPGAERQQLKWALLGLAAGVLLWLPGGSIEANLWSELPLLAKAYVFVLMRIGLIAMAVTLLFALLGFRLNDADAVIGHSATYSVVTAVVGGVWAAGAHYAGETMEEFGRAYNEPLAVAISALLAAAIFNPTKRRVEQWTEARFRGPLMRLRSLPARIGQWQVDDEPEVVARRALAAIAEAARASATALVSRTEDGPAEIIAYGAGPEAVRAYLDETVPRRRADDAFPLRMESKDPDEPSFELLIGQRSDGAFYSREERAALAALVEPLADTLRAASRRAARHLAVKEALAEIATRLGHASPRKRPAGGSP